MNKERLRERAKDIPDELREYYSLEMIMNGNSTALHNLYKKAKDGKRFQEAFLYFFYEFEINLKHMIMSEMMVVNNLKALEEQKDELFPIYSRAEIYKVQKIGKVFKLIEVFCSVYGNEVKEDLIGLNRNRNFIIHNMLKEEMDEQQIEKSFEAFFIASNSAISNAYHFFNKTMEERPRKFLAVMEKIVEQKAQQSS